MSLRDLKLTPLGVMTDAEALTNEKLQEEIKKMKKKDKIKVEKKNKKEKHD